MTSRPLLLPFLSLAALTIVPAAAQQSRPAKAAEAFRLDALAPTSGTPAPTEPTPATPPVVVAPVTEDNAAVTVPAGDPVAAAAPTGVRALFTLDTPIRDLIADPAARAVLDKDLPGLSTDQNLDRFDRFGLRQFQSMTGGQLTDAMLRTVARDLSRLSGPVLMPPPSARPSGTSRRRDTSR